MKGKIIVVSAPSGTGKSTIINAILAEGEVCMQFSVSATNRTPREGEADGVNYHFLTTEDFRQRVANDQFVEWEEVYPGRYYGTLKSEIDNKTADGANIVLDIDVKGAQNVKRIYGDEALLLFIQPPSIDALRQRLEGRGTETQDVIEQRLSRAEYEISFAPQFDATVVNDELATAIAETKDIIKNFLKGNKE